MPLIQAEYANIRHWMRVGDGLAFGGEGFVSDFIKWWTRSQVSHWATVIEVGDIVRMAESTILSDKKGVQINDAGDRIAEYPGRVWWLPLSRDARARLKVDAMTGFLHEQVGKPYDKKLIGHLLFDRFNLVPSREGWGAFDCSELGAAGYKAGGILPLNLNSSEMVPQELAEARLWMTDYYQLRGKPKQIRGFNSRNV